MPICRANGSFDRGKQKGNAMKRLAVGIVLATCLFIEAPSASASTDISEITDMWWNPAESGWGLNIILQNNVAFATFFIYDSSGKPVWYTAQLADQGNFVFSGSLYATTGPWFGGPFNAGSVTVRPAGTATFTLQYLNQAALTYSVDGVAVSKTLQRQTWTNEDYSGNYAGGYSISATGCSPSYLNGLTEAAGFLTVTQSGTAFSMFSSSNLGTCTFTGTYSQMGKLGQVQGTYSCSSGERGNFDMFEMTPTISGFTARVQGSNQFCSQWSGYAGGIARAQ